MITSDRRGLGTRRKAEPLGVITRHRHLHHFIAQQAIPNVIQSASPIGPKLRRGGEEALIGELSTHLHEKGIVL